MTCIDNAESLLKSIETTVMIDVACHKKICTLTDCSLDLALAGTATDSDSADGSCAVAEDSHTF